MTFTTSCRTVTALMVAALISNVSWSADSSRDQSDSTKAPAGAATRGSSSTRTLPTSRTSAGKGPLPDPALLDGSTLQAEKKSEHGMIGDFELPGDENVRDGKVGGPQSQNPGARGGQSNNMPMGLPQGGGGGQQSDQQQAGGAQAQGGAQGQQAGAQGQQAGAQQAGGAQAGGPQNANAGGNPVAGAGDPGAQAQGVQVAELGGEGSAQGAIPPGEKPGPVAIGDSAMRIEQSATAAGVVGAQQQQVTGHTQQHEKGTGSGGKGSGGAQGGNRVEKGRTIPAGL
jgi:hypothetical protein